MTFGGIKVANVGHSLSMKPNDFWPHIARSAPSSQGVPWYDFTLNQTYSRSPELKGVLLNMKVFPPEGDHHLGKSVICIWMYHQSHQLSHAEYHLGCRENSVLDISQVSALTVDHREQWLYTSSKDNSIKVACPIDYHHGITVTNRSMWRFAMFDCLIDGALGFSHTIDKWTHGISFACLSLSSWLGRSR